jgi:hypothetical protein
VLTGTRYVAEAPGPNSPSGSPASRWAVNARPAARWIAEADVAGLAAQILAEPDAKLRVALMARLNRRQWELGQDVIPMLEAAGSFGFRGGADACQLEGAARPNNP